MENVSYDIQDGALRLFKSSQVARPVVPILEEPTLFYQPPYQSMLEDELAWHFAKYLHEEASFQDYAKITTPYATFPVDFLVELGKQRIGFMCGLMEGDNERAESGFKDALLIDAGGVDVLYRFRVQDIRDRLHDCLQLVAVWNPGLFSTRGLVNLERLSSAESRAFAPSYNQSIFVLSLSGQKPLEDVYFDEPFTWPGAAETPVEVLFRRMSRQYPAAWMFEYERALAYYGVTDDVLRRKWPRSA